MLKLSVDQTRARESLIKAIADKVFIVSTCKGFTLVPLQFDACVLSDVYESFVCVDTAKIMVRYHKSLSDACGINIVCLVTPFMCGTLVRYRVTYKGVPQE